MKPLDENEIIHIIRQKVGNSVEINFIENTMHVAGRTNFKFNNSDFKTIVTSVSFNPRYKNQWFKFVIYHEIGHIKHYLSNDEKLQYLLEQYGFENRNLKLISYLEERAKLNAIKLAEEDNDMATLFGCIFEQFDSQHLVDYDRPNDTFITKISKPHAIASRNIMKNSHFKNICRRLNSEFLKENIIPV